MNRPGDTERCPAPSVDVDVIEAVVGDLQVLEGISRGTADGLHEIVARLKKQAADARERSR